MEVLDCESEWHLKYVQYYFILPTFTIHKQRTHGTIFDQAETRFVLSQSIKHNLTQSS